MLRIIKKADIRSDSYNSHYSYIRMLTYEV